MTPRIVDISPREENDAWKKFPGTDIQKVLHNSLTQRIEETRLRLEACATEECAGHQASIKELRALLVVIHGKDSAEIQAIYG
jgi:hypothetical protein